MPVYEWSCQCGTTIEAFRPYAESDAPMHCACGKAATRIISRPSMVRVRHVEYTSPIDGRPITTMKARQEDLARNNCIAYDPGMRQDYQRRVAESERQLDRALDQSVEAAVEKMPSRKREQLASELTRGAACEVVRSTLGA